MLELDPELQALLIAGITFLVVECGYIIKEAVIIIISHGKNFLCRIQPGKSKIKAIAD